MNNTGFDELDEQLKQQHQYYGEPNGQSPAVAYSAGLTVIPPRRLTKGLNILSKFCNNQQREV
jgi:hypothetical protein